MGLRADRACRSKIIGEFDIWRRVRDAEGAEGWVHKKRIVGQARRVGDGKRARIARRGTRRCRSGGTSRTGGGRANSHLRRDWCRLNSKGSRAGCTKAISGALIRRKPSIRIEADFTFTSFRNVFYAACGARRKKMIWDSHLVLSGSNRKWDSGLAPSARPGMTRLIDPSFGLFIESGQATLPCL